MTLTKSERYQREWAKLIGKRRLSAFERALTDPDLVSLKQELVKVDLRIADLEERARKGESRGQWHHVKAFARELEATLLDADDESAKPEPLNVDKLRDLVARLGACADQGVQERELWDEITALIELRRKLSDTERKYEELRNYKVPATEIVRLLDDLHGAIEMYVADRLLRFQIFNEVRARANGESHARARVPITLPAAYLAAAPPPDDDPGEDGAEALAHE